MEPATCPCTELSACWRPHFAGSTLNASRKLGIGWCFAALLASSAGAETRVYGALASNYVFRGVSWSDERASASAGLDWQHPTGIYGGGNVTSVSSGVEMDGYAGYTRQVGMFSVDFGASLYDYSDEGYIDGEFREVYVGGQVGPVAVGALNVAYHLALLDRLEIDISHVLEIALDIVLFICVVMAGRDGHAPSGGGFHGSRPARPGPPSGSRSSSAAVWRMPRRASRTAKSSSTMRSRWESGRSKSLSGRP